MGKQRGGRGSKYSDEFKRRLVAESHVDGVSMPMVSRRHGVPTSRIYAWRGDVRFQPGGSDDAGFMPVEISTGNHDAVPVLPETQPTASPILKSRLRTVAS